MAVREVCRCRPSFAVESAFGSGFFHVRHFYEVLYRSSVSTRSHVDPTRQDWSPNVARWTECALRQLLLLLVGTAAHRERRRDREAQRFVRRHRGWEQNHYCCPSSLGPLVQDADSGSGGTDAGHVLRRTLQPGASPGEGSACQNR